MVERADIAAVNRGLLPTRSRARVEIKAGRLLVGGVAVRKASQNIQDDDQLSLVDDVVIWVSRSAEKLSAALAHWQIDARDKTAIDVGASTGGFTQVLLDGAAAKVYAVDVGHDQLHDTLRRRNRVVSLEGLDARNLTQDHISEPVDLIVSDVSFISLKKTLPVPLSFLKPGGQVIALIKPQFEAGRDRVGRGGMVKDEAVHREICDDIQAWFETVCGLKVLGVIDSPILGGDGSKEFLIAATS